jgi:tetratricopeptide (TPR) repeat protein
MKRVAFVVAVVLAACKESPPPAPAQPAAPTQPPPPQEISVTSKSPEAVALFKQGRELFENQRWPEAIEVFKKAIALDPDFAQAHAYLGFAMQGPERKDHLDKALASAAALPEAERLVIDETAALLAGDSNKLRDLRARAAQLAPTDWRVHEDLGIQLRTDGKYDESAAEMKRAAELNPKAGPVFNDLGYTYLLAGKYADAVAAFQKYVELSPTEANAHDSLAEALLNSGKLAESEAEFQKALATNPKFINAWEGVANARAYRGDWAGAREALGKRVEAEADPLEKLGYEFDLVVLITAEGKKAEVAKAIADFQKKADEQKSDLFRVLGRANHAEWLLESGKGAEADKQLVEAGAALDGGKFLPVQSQGLRRLVLALRTWAAALQGKVADAQKSAAAWDELLKASPGNDFTQKSAHFVRGMVALAGKDAKAAAAEFGQCSELYALCQRERVEALEKAGDKPGADAVRSAFLAVHRRGMEAIWSTALLGGIGAKAATAAK